MTDGCSECSCALSDPEMEVETEELPSELQFQKEVRDYVLDKLDLNDEDTFIEEVVVCPERTEVSYRDES